jgi:hypothetical protein
MYSAAKDKWITLAATLDTGTPDNWICERALEALGLEQTLKTTQVELMDFSGKRVTSAEIVGISWCATESRNIRQDKFRVAKSATFDVVLGSYLLSEGVFSLDKPAWTLDKKDNHEGKCNSMIESF